MAKYYIQSGEIKLVVTAADAEGAAMWVLNRTINQIIPVDTIEDRHLDAGTIECVIQGLDYLDPEIHVSEIGFGRNEVAIFDTEILFKQWCQLLYAMNSLFDQLDG